MFSRELGGQIKRDCECRTFEGGKIDEKDFLIKNFPLNAVVRNQIGHENENTQIDFGLLMVSHQVLVN